MWNLVLLWLFSVYHLLQIPLDPLCLGECYIAGGFFQCSYHTFSFSLSLWSCASEKVFLHIFTWNMTLLMGAGEDILYCLVLGSVLHRPCAPGSPEEGFLSDLALFPVLEAVFVLFCFLLLSSSHSGSSTVP